ncbi:MAG: RNA methyltransferase, partial [Candidatus Cloacimonetes bacterium]|nr:RNA methyltransferase [Candidatus Cloacimonadota bacterium]
YLDGISDPGNMGTIFRSVAAFGIEAVFLSPACCEVFSPKVIRSSLGSVFWVKHERIEDERLFSDKHDLISIIQDGAILLQDYEASSTTPSIYIIGSEANGIRQELLTRSQTNLRLQMMGRMESLNASVTAGIVCWWLSLKQ